MGIRAGGLNAIWPTAMERNTPSTSARASPRVASGPRAVSGPRVAGGGPPGLSIAESAATGGFVVGAGWVGTGTVSVVDTSTSVLSLSGALLLWKDSATPTRTMMTAAAMAAIHFMPVSV